MSYSPGSFLVLLVFLAQACSTTESEAISKSEFPVFLAKIQDFNINLDLEVDSTSVGTDYFVNGDTILSGREMSSCICTNTENGISISIRSFYTFESKYLDIDYNNGTYNSAIEYVSDLPDPEAELFRQSLTLNQFDFLEGDTLKGYIQVAGLVLDEESDMDSVQFITKGLFQCVVKEPLYDWNIWNNEMVAEYNIDRVVQFSRLANSDSASKVTSLDLNNLGLTSIPKEIVHFKNLEELWMIGNDVTYFDLKLLSQLKNLRLINLENSEIQRLPENIDQLSKLEILNLGSNPIKSIPKSIYKLSNLTELDLSLTKISIIDPEIRNLTQLQKLDLGSNYDLYSIPEEVFELRRLKILRLPIIFDSYDSRRWTLDRVCL